MLPDRVSNPGPLTYESVPYRLRKKKSRCKKRVEKKKNGIKLKMPIMTAADDSLEYFFH